jgi:hypothetical protein
MATKSWRDTLPVHPAAELFPRMSEAELAALAEDIKANELKSPVVLWAPESKTPTRYVLDGINRLDAMERAGIQFLTDTGEPINLYFQTKFETKPQTIGEGRRIKKGEHVEPTPDTDPWAYVISANLHRRHLDAEQKRDLIAKLVKAQPEKSDRQIAETVKVDHKTVGAVRVEQEARGEIPHVETRTDTKGRKQPARKPSPKPQPTQAPASNSAGAEFQSVRRRTDSSAQTASNTSQDRDDIGPASTGEVERLRVYVEQLEWENHLLEQDNEALRKDIDGPGALSRAWARASEGARRVTMSQFGLVPDRTREAVS